MKRQIVQAEFAATWDVALNHALPRVREQLRESYDIDNISMQFIQPWGGREHTEFIVQVELGENATAQTAEAVKKWLQHTGRSFLREIRPIKKY